MNIIGSTSLCILLCISSALCGSLVIYNKHGAVSQEVVAGERCRIEYKVDQNVAKNGWPQIPGLPLDSIIGRQQRHEVTWYNGAQSTQICFVWEVVFSVPGTYTLGPLQHAGKECAPARVLNVHEAQPTTKPMDKTAPFIQWELATLNPFAGEVVPIQLIIYTTDHSLHLDTISEVHLDNGELELCHEPQWSSKQHNGITYKTITWSGTIRFFTEGVHTIPSVLVSYKTQITTASPWALMQHMFGAFAPSAQQRAGPVSVRVRALPACTHHIVGVGVLRNAQRSVSSQKLSCNEAGTVTYRLTGSLHPKSISLPPFESKYQVTVYNQEPTCQGQYPEYVYEREYVLHPHRAENIVLAEQELWFFNPKSEQYEMIKLPRTDILVDEEHHVQEVSQEEPSIEKASLPQADPPVPQPFIPVLSLSLSWFLVLLVIPCAVMITRSPLRSLWKRSVTWIRINYLFFQTRRAIQAATATHNGYALHSAIERCITSMISIPPDRSVHSYVPIWLQGHGFPQERIADWNDVQLLLERAAFTPDEQTEYMPLAKRSLEWLSRMRLYHD